MARLVRRNSGRLAGTVLDVLATLDGISGRALDMVDDAGVGGLPVYWNSRLRTTAGVCVYARRDGLAVAIKLELNPKLREESPEALRNTFLHELAHAVAGHAAKHGAAWKRTHRALGGTAERCHSYEAMASARVRRTRRHVATCERCGYEVHRARALMAGRTYTHRGCGGKLSPC